MLEEQLPLNKNELLVEPAKVQIVFNEDRKGLLSVLAQPVETTNDAESHPVFSDFLIHMNREEEQENFKSFLEYEIANQMKKWDRHGASPIFVNRLANLAQLSGNRELEETYLKKIIELSSSKVFVDKLGENLVARNRFDEAERLFAARDLDNDLHANLRLAFFFVKRADLTTAEQYLSRAIRIEPLDYASRLFEGSLRLIQNDPAAAIRCFRIAEGERPNSAVLHANFAAAYAAQRNYQRALTSAKRSVALDPLNINAIGLLSDLAFKEGCSEDAVPALRYYLSIHGKMPLIWAQLARALLHIGSFDEAITALRRQQALTDTPEVWNNLGVAYTRKGGPNVKRALDAFSYAAGQMRLDGDKTSLIALRNLCSVLTTQEAHDQVLKLTRIAAFVDDRFEEVVQNEQLSDIFIFRILSLVGKKRRDEALELAELILRHRASSTILLAWVSSFLIASYALRENTRALLLSEFYDHLIRNDRVKTAGLSDMLINNIAFAFAQFNQIERAEHYISLAASRIHKDAYPTATLGLLNMRRGNIDRATALYDEAIGLAKSAADKLVIRQKMNLELGLANLVANPNAARRYLERAEVRAGASAELSEKARILKQSLSFNR